MVEEKEVKVQEQNDEDLENVTGGEDLNGITDFFKKIGKGIKDIAKPVIK